MARMDFVEAADWFRARHTRVMNALGKLVDSTRTRASERLDALRTVTAELNEHDHLQEQLLALLGGLPGEGRIVDRCRAEQADTRRLLETLRSTDPTAREFQLQAEALHAQLEHRTTVEERELLGRVEDGRIADEQLQTIIEAHAGPDAPHPTERRGGPAPVRS